jgi:hypothetical protein
VPSAEEVKAQWSFLQEETELTERTGRGAALRKIGDRKMGREDFNRRGAKTAERERGLNHGWTLMDTDLNRR